VERKRRKRKEEGWKMEWRIEEGEWSKRERGGDEDIEKRNEGGGTVRGKVEIRKVYV